MGAAETGGVRRLSSRPLGCVCTFSSFFFFFSEVDSGLKLDFSKASILPYLDLRFPHCKPQASSDSLNIK